MRLHFKISCIADDRCISTSNQKQRFFKDLSCKGRSENLGQRIRFKEYKIFSRYVKLLYTFKIKSFTIVCFNLNSDTQRKKARGTRYNKNIRDLTKEFELGIKQQAKVRAAQEKAMKKPIRLKTQMPFSTGQTASPDISSDSDDGLNFFIFKERCLCMN
jgi:hypothetical protein